MRPLWSQATVGWTSSIISLYKKRLLKPRTTEYGLNCRTTLTCQLENQCLTPNLIPADIGNNANEGTKIYFGLAKTSFKARFANHNKDFNYELNCQNMYGR